MERRGRAAAHVVVAQIGTAQLSNPRTFCSKILFNVHVCTEENTEGKMNSEPGDLEPSWAGTSFEAPDSSVSSTGKWNELLSTAVFSSKGLWREILFTS